MVVKYLERFVEDEVPGGFYPSSLEELIEKAKGQTGKKSELVLDASSVVSLFCKDVEVSCNGQLKLLKEKIKVFVEKIRQLGAEISVFFPGTNDFKDLSRWKSKRLCKIEDVETFFDKLKTGDERARVEHVQVVAAKLVAENTFLSCEGCTVRTTLNECVREVSEHVKNRKEAVLLGQDSDYLIYPGIEVYVSMKSVDLQTLTCKVFDSNELARHLRLERKDLPLLATLAGNETVPEFVLRNFHCKLCDARGKVQERKKVYQALADFVRDLPRERDPYANLTSVLRSISDHRVGERVLKLSLDGYLKTSDASLGPKSSKVLRVAREKKRFCIFSPPLVSILEKNELRTNNDLEDFRDGDVKPAARILRPLRQRIYGILLHDAEKTYVLEHCVEGAKRKGKYVIDEVKVEAELPYSEHPGLLALWQDHSAEMEEKKKKLFCEAIDPDLEPEDLIWIPPKLILPAVALRYLSVGSNPGFFWKEAEAEAFLATALITVEASADDLKNVKLQPLDPRAVRMSSVFLRCCATLQILNEACGFVVPKQDTCPSHFYDGNVFSSVFNRLKSGESYRDILGSDASASILFRTLLNVISIKCK